jgi:hypothetical protein
LFER